ncbi:MAG TPA: translation initiation factor IF-2 [Methanomicrobiales archaeon]|jgi:translation initiation factor 5B|nr:translation initiation factor IF-2 [Methanomicrobiales archaeon]
MAAPEPAGIRTPIVCVLGHVDHGKTSLLDRIRGSSVVDAEEGAITQHIGATLVPLDAIRKMSGTLGRLDIQVPGLLFIDTPGHHAFTTLRARGGALAEMAILVVDINEGFQPQTLEALGILRTYKTPFVVAATKIDRIHGWRVHEGEPFQATFGRQGERSRDALENRTYEIVGRLSELGFASERYDRITDFQRNIAIVPVSSHTGEGIPDLLMILIGLAQRFLKEDLAFRAEGPARGTVLEVKEERGLGMTLDVILYDGTLSVGDEVMLATSDGVVVTKIRSLLSPRPLREIRVEDRFDRVRSVVAAAGIKVAAPDLEKVVAGSPLMAVRGNREEVEATIRGEMENILVTLSEEGITVKADTIGALEALSKELEGKSIGILRASVGPVARHDIVEVQTVTDPLSSVLLSFNTPILPDAQELLKDPSFAHVKLFEGKVIYQLINDYLAWRDAEIRKKEAARFEQVVLPARFMLLPNCVFRQSNPAVVGVRVLLGKLRAGVELVDRTGKRIGHLKTMQSRGENIREADAGAEVAVSIEGVTVGRQVNVNDELMVEIPERHVKILEHEMFAHLSPSMRECLEDYTGMMRKGDPFWGK